MQEPVRWPQEAGSEISMADLVEVSSQVEGERDSVWGGET